MSSLSEIKTAIKAKLDELKTAGTLADVQEDDFKVGILERDIMAYPCAILTTPTIESSAETNRDNTRIYTYEIVVVQKQELINAATDIEDLAEAILNKFDNDPTLGGKADAGVEPATSSPQAAISRGKGVIFFSVILRVKKIIALTF